MSPRITYYYDVEVFCPLNIEWSIWVPTGPGIGNNYQIIKDEGSCFLNIRHGQPKAHPHAWSSSFVVGKVPVHQLLLLETYLTSQPMFPEDPDWNPRRWILDALSTLRAIGFEIEQVTEWDFV
ncbi:hypothetical protein EDB19DRAFT_1824923 [Suillus lakei]|nr:hypothetical protein EDB19DRAFT_1824923 [Suillus lakei]